MVLMLSLGRTGSLPLYAENIFLNLNGSKIDFIISKNRTNKTFIKNSTEVLTYTNKATFLFNTLFYLPFLILKTIPKIHKEYNTLYLPYKHFWDIPFIFLFKLFGKKVVFTAHDGVLHTGERNFITQGLNNYRLKKADVVLFLTNYTRKHVEEELGIFNNYQIVTHPIIENHFVKIKDSFNTRNLLFLGRIDKYKGVELLMESVVDIENSFDKLIIAGRSLYDIDYINHPKIEVIDKYLSNKEIGELLSWADVLILPYTEATQSGVITLGIYAELPMICTSVGGFSEQLKDDECFWSEPNIKSLQETITSAILNVNKRNKIKEKLKLKKETNSWLVITAKIESIIQNI